MMWDCTLLNVLKPTKSNQSCVTIGRWKYLEPENIQPNRYATQMVYFGMFPAVQCTVKPWQLAYILLGQLDVQFKGQGMARLGDKNIPDNKWDIKKELVK
jgi:hypothetical protein